MNPLLLLVADSRLPAGGHTQSVGVESAIHYGDVTDAVTLERYLRGRLATTGHTEAAFAARVATPGAGETAADVLVLDAELAARLLSPRQRQVSRQLGRQLLRVAANVGGSGVLTQLGRLPEGPLQPLALGALIAAVGGTPIDAATIQLHHIIGAGTTAAVRLLGLDPIELVQLSSRLGVEMRDLAERATADAARPVVDLPSWGGTLTEILSEDHGAWDHRMFAA
ncbi:MAG: urease accessory UreF family protein [Actinomycetota bacterium]